MKKLLLLILICTILFNIISENSVNAIANKPRNPRLYEVLDNYENPFPRLVFLISFLINIVLLLFLLILYLINFKSTKSYFTLGLSFFIGVLLMQKLMFFFFPLLPQLFETFALAILIILTLK
jgi:hypothetical protein